MSASTSQAPPAPTAVRRHAVRRRLGLGATGALLAVLVVLGLTKIDLAEVARALARVDGWWVAAAVAGMAGAFLCRAESWYAALRAALPGGRIGRGAVTRALLIGMAGSVVAPGRLGEAVRTWLIARRAGGVRDAAAPVIGTVLAQTLLNVLALILLSAAAVAGSAIPGARTESLVLSALVPALCVVALLGAPALLARGRSRRSGPLRRVSDWLRAQLVDVRHGLVVFRRAPCAVHSGAFQLAAWALQCASAYAVLLAFDLEDHANLAAAAAVLVAVNVTAVLPVTPSNVGVFQAACIAVLAPFGVTAGHGLAYGLVLQAVEVGCALVMGVPALLHEGVSIAELRARADGPRCAPPPPADPAGDPVGDRPAGGGPARSGY